MALGIAKQRLNVGDLAVMVNQVDQIDLDDLRNRKLAVRRVDPALFPVGRQLFDLAGESFGGVLQLGFGGFNGGGGNRRELRLRSARLCIRHQLRGEVQSLRDMKRDFLRRRRSWRGLPTPFVGGHKIEIKREVASHPARLKRHVLI